nr:hypothetical protein [Tanacetum cinerariifolium]
PTPTTTVESAPRLSATAKGSDDDSDETVKAGSGKDDDGNDDEDDDDNDEEEEIAKNDEEDTETGKGGNEVRESEGVESIFTTASSPIVSLQTPTPIMTPSTIATITTSGDVPIPPPTIPSITLENLPTFNSAFRFDERLSTSVHDPVNDGGRPRGSSDTD